MEIRPIWDYLTTSFEPVVVLLGLIAGGLGLLLWQSLQINRSVNHRGSNDKSLAQLTLENNRMILETQQLATHSNVQLGVIDGRLRRVEKTLRRHSRKLYRKS